MSLEEAQGAANKAQQALGLSLPVSNPDDGVHLMPSTLKIHHSSNSQDSESSQQ